MRLNIMMEHNLLSRFLTEKLLGGFVMCLSATRKRDVKSSLYPRTFRIYGYWKLPWYAAFGVNAFSLEGGFSSNSVAGVL